MQVVDAVGGRLNFRVVVGLQNPFRLVQGKFAFLLGTLGVPAGQDRPGRVAALFRIPPERISHFVAFDVANAIKFTLYRDRPNGSPGDWDVLGCQQYGPLYDMEIE